jgi:hypothetical protein
MAWSSSDRASPGCITEVVAVAKRVCIQSGCGTLIDAGRSRCDNHARDRDKARGTRQQRGYDATHDSLRASWQRRLDGGLRVHCWRCARLIDPSSWHLGHCDDDRSRYHGPECPSCNLATNAGRTQCPHQSHSDP